MQSKIHVSIERFATAERVFMAALRLNARDFFRSGMAFNENGLSVLSVIKPDDAPEDGFVMVGEGEVAEKGWPVTIEVDQA